MITLSGFERTGMTALCVTALIASLLGCSDVKMREAGVVRVLGSETVRPLAEACASAYTDKHPDADIAIQGGGSGDGINALLSGMVDVGMASREATDKERATATTKGTALTEHAMAQDGIAIIVNNANPLATLDIAQLRELYSAAQRPNWKALNGEDKSVMIFARGGSSGTASVFQTKVLNNGEYSSTVQRLLDNDAIVAAVAAQPHAIGYTGMEALRNAGGKVRVIALKADAQSLPVLPSAESVRAGSYPLVRKLYFYTAGQAKGTVKSFVETCQDLGQRSLVQKLGYVNLVAKAN